MEEKSVEQSMLAFKEKVEKWSKKNFGKKIGIGLILVLLIWVSSGIYSVQPGEQAVIRQFGKHVGVTDPGLRYRLPLPFQTHDKVDIANVRRAEIGFRTVESRAQRKGQEALMLTGDENIVEAQLIVQYLVQNPRDFLFNVRDPEQTLRAATEVALRGAVGKNTIDFTMTEGRVLVEAEVKEYLQSLLDLYETGILVTGVNLLVVDPPEEVKDAFNEVVRAWEDREKLVQEAEAYREDIIPRARGGALELINQAEAYKERRILDAQGDADRFISVMEEYSKAKDVTRQRLYLEMIEKVLPDVRKYIIEGQGDGNLLQILPLSDLKGDN